MNAINTKSSRKSVITGSVIIIIGLLWLLRKMGVFLPGWLFEWPTILLAIGLIINLNHNFRHTTGYILMGIGAFGLAYEFLNIPFEIRKYAWPLAVIVIGVIVLLRPSKARLKREEEEANSEPGSERLDSVSIFNGLKRNLSSKKFRGGESVSIFGGSEINMLNADFEGEIELEATVIFGGLKLIVPKDWEVQIKTTNIFGGVEDKRFMAVEVSSSGKRLVLNGAVIFGGIDIVSI